MDNITKIVFDKNKPIEQLKKNELYIFLEDIFKNLMKRININDRINIKDIKENLTLMISNIDKHKKKFKEFKNQISISLNKELEKLHKEELEFKAKIQNKLNEMLNKWEEISSKEMEKKRNDVFENFKKPHENYLNVFEDINKKIIS